MKLAHPGMQVRRELIERIGIFDASIKICGDYEWFLRLPASLRAIHTHASILKIVQAGVSHAKIGAVYAEIFRAQTYHLNLFWSAGCWLLKWFRYGRRRLMGLV